VRKPAIHMLALATMAFGWAVPPAAADAPTDRQGWELGPMEAMVPLTGVSSMDPSVTGTLFQPHELLLGSEAPRGLRAVIDAQMTLLQRTWGTPVVDLRGFPVKAETEATEIAPAARHRVPLVSSDVNGDGREDALFFDIGLDENNVRIEAGITALDGSSGDKIWTNMYGNPYNLIVLSPGDVTGDGADDLFVIVMESEREENLPVGGPGVPYDNVYTYKWDLTLVSGVQGSTEWGRSIDGSLRYQGVFVGQGPTVTEVAHITGVNALVDVRRSEDLDGDGLADFALNVHDYEREFIYSNFVRETDRYVYDTEAEALAGDSGITLLTRSRTDQAGAAFLLPLGEATGDGRADLLWAVPTETHTPTICAGTQGCVEKQLVELYLELVNPTSSGQGWALDVKDEGVVAAEPLMTGRDLTGDGRADVLVGLTLEDGSQKVVAVSGADGQRAWTFDTLITDVPTAIGSIDGGQGSDLLFWEGQDVFDTEAPTWFRIRLRRVNGASGQELFSTQRELVDDEETNNDSIFASSVGDVNADGVPDIAHAIWHSDGYWEPEGSASSVVSIESGASGDELLRMERDRNALLFNGGDLEPGGPQDLLEGSVPYDNTNFRLRGIEMPTCRVLWSHTDALYTAYFGSLRSRTGGGDHVMYARTQVSSDAPRVRSRIDALHGQTGAFRWGVGPQLIPAPA
jgi:hypothetical protein